LLCYIESVMNTHVNTSSLNAPAITPDHLRISASTPTDGETKVKRRLHVLLNYVVNYIISIGITDLFLGTKKADGDREPTSIIGTAFGNNAVGRTLGTVSQALYSGSNVARDTMRKGLSFAGELLSREISGTVVNVFTLMMGGHITGAITAHKLNKLDVLAEKEDLKLDKKRGYTPTPEELEARQARYEYLRQQPKKTAWTVIKGRALGLVFNVASTTISNALDWRLYNSEKKQAIKDAHGKTGVRAITEWAGDKISRGVLAARPNMGDMGKKRLNFWSELALTELFFTANTTVAFKLVADRGEKAPAGAPQTKPAAAKHEEDDSRPPAITSVHKWADSKVKTQEERKAEQEAEKAENSLSLA